MGQASFVTLEEANVVRGSGHSSELEVFFGNLGVVSEGPQAFRANVNENEFGRAHFHHTKEFQVFFGASDTKMQRHLVGPMLVHYADSDTMYGPITSGEKFSFLTLRATGSDFTGYMPENKSDMPHGQAKRHYEKDLRSWLDETYPPEGVASIETVIEPHADQLAAYKVTAAPGASAECPPPPADSGGQYFVVIDGEFSHRGRILPKFTIGWASPSDEPPELIAGLQGARVLVLQFGSE